MQATAGAMRCLVAVGSAALAVATLPSAARADVPERAILAAPLSSAPASSGRQTRADLLGSVVLAQNTAVPPTSPSGSVASAPAAAGEVTETAEIVVTGSRISRRDFQANSPIATINPVDIQSTGAPTLGALITQMPQVAATVGTLFGRSTVNLRGLGGARSLVLLDGRRMQPSDGFGTVDLNILAPALIGSAELVTGGASAVYGSDAISGVLNIKLNRNIRGFLVDAQVGITEVGDSATKSLTGAWGGQTADGRGSLLVALSWADREHSRRTDREFFRQSTNSTNYTPISLTFSNGAPSRPALNALFAGYGETGVPNPAGPFTVNFDGTIAQSSNPLLNCRYLRDTERYAVINGACQQYYGQLNDLQTPLTRYVGLIDGDYKLTENLTVYGQFLYTTYKNTGYAPNGGLLRASEVELLVPVTNPFITADLRRLLQSRPNPNLAFPVTGTTRFVGPLIQESDSDIYQLTGGLRGAIPGTSFTWDAYGSIGKTKQALEFRNLISLARFNQVVQAPDGGASLCTGGVNLFPAESVSESCQAFLRASAVNLTELEQRVAEASFQGGLFNLPAGSLRVAGGLSYRYNSLDYQPSRDMVSVGGAPIPLVGIAPTVGTKGSTSVKEVFGELLIPVLKDLPLINELNVDVATRYADYDTIGGVWTYKGDLDWTLFPGVRARGGYQRAIRAPSVGELFEGRQSASHAIGRNFQGGGDPCDFTGNARTGPNGAQVRQLCIATGVPAQFVDSLFFAGGLAPGTRGGNPNLKEETADTRSIGLVLTPRFGRSWAKQFSFSIDYYDIKITDAIGQLSAINVLTKCYNMDGSNPSYSPTNPNCLLIKRQPNGQIQSLDTQAVNLSSYRASGIDAQVDWGLDLEALGFGSRAGSLALSMLVSYVDKYQIQTDAVAPLLEYAGTIGNQQIEGSSPGSTTVIQGAISHPRWKASGSITYSRGNTDISLRGRYIGSMTNALNVGVPNGTQPGVKSRTYFDLNVRTLVRERFEFRFGVNNLFDTYPPEWTGYGATDFATYDILGRRFTAGVTARF